MKLRLHCAMGGVDDTGEVPGVGDTRHLRLGLTRDSATLAWLNISPTATVARLGPVVLQVKDPKRHPLLFSQRGRGLLVGRWWLRLSWSPTPPA